MMRHSLLAHASLLALATALVACGKPEEKKADPAAQAVSAKAPASSPTTGTATSQSAKALLLSAEDLHTLDGGNQASGPVVTGSLLPEKRADLRAEVPALVLAVLKENGERVRRGDLLVRLDDTSIRDSLASAEEAARASGQSFEQAERQHQRLKTLQAQGMSSLQAMEDAEVRRNNAQSDLVAARARVASARQQLTRTEVRAPFDGVVSERKVSAGDTAQMGKELVKVIAPETLRFEGRVSADRLPELKAGQAVAFKVNGYPDTEFKGRVKRIDASANALTRQVEVLIAIEGEAPSVSGLYAEGRIQTGDGSGRLPTVPESAVQTKDGRSQVWQFKDGKIMRTEVQLGERDARRGHYAIRNGLLAGAQVLRNPGSNLVDGQIAELAKAGTAKGG
jgi:RND family efflux transporter MFP subunit